ncbi:contractile injection system tape measure protein [Aquimarina pacifica]|uniref:contractile injection system tape measure protein n=1 Tax=Aquimarina pacifica TaxID=1296415 RepID=UPI00047009C7|nr:contractile injection system tape measure protein [Aquimarina pacifica]
MAGSKKHIINKVFVEVQTTSKSKAFEIKDRLDMFLKEQVFPELEKYFENLEELVEHNIIRIDRLELDMNVRPDFSYEDVQNAIVKSVGTQINEQVQSKSKNMSLDHEDSKVFLSERQSDVATFFYFLEQGVLPWWGDKKALHFLEQRERFLEVIRSNVFKNKLIESLKRPIIRQRLVKQLADELILQIVINLYENIEGVSGILTEKILTHEFNDFLSQVSSKNRELLWEELFLFFQTKNVLRLYHVLKKVQEIPQIKMSKEQQWLNAILEFLKSEKSKGGMIHKKLSEVKPINKKLENDILLENLSEDLDALQSEEKDAEVKKSEEVQNGLILQDEEIQKEISYEQQSEYYIENAGLLLLHPFLKHFFEHCDLLDENKNFKNPALAVHALHYIATKKEKQLECAMVFEKFICNIPIQEPIDRNIKLSETIKDEADELLKAALENWEGLKTSSIDLLRNEFVQRPGKLILTEEHPKITMERKTQDILLDRVPWNISIIKLPWKPKLIFVNW